MWARSVTLPIRKLKCWVNAILPIMFIKEMNKLVVLSMKHEQKANFKSAPLPPFVLHTEPLQAVHLTPCSVPWLAPHPQICVAGCLGVILQILGYVREDARHVCFHSRWLSAPPPPPPDVRGFSGTGGLSRTDCVTRQAGIRQTLLGHGIRLGSERRTSAMHACVTNDLNVSGLVASQRPSLSPIASLIILLNLVHEKQPDPDCLHSQELLQYTYYILDLAKMADSDCGVASEPPGQMSSS